MLMNSGLRYCLTHDGIVQEDEGEPCDFARRGLLDDEQPDCVLTPLFYESRPADATGGGREQVRCPNE